MKENKQFIEYATGGFNIHLTPYMIKALHWVAISGNVFDKSPEAQELTDQLHGCGLSKPDRFVMSMNALMHRGLIDHIDPKKRKRSEPSYVLTDEGRLVHELCVRAKIVAKPRIRVATN